MRGLIAEFMAGKTGLPIFRESVKTILSINEILDPFKHNNVVFRGYTALEFSIKIKNVELTNILLEEGADVNCGTWKPLLVAISNVENINKGTDPACKILKCLSEHPATNMNIRFPATGKNLFDYALEKGNSFVEWVLTKTKFNINTPGDNNFPPVYLAVGQGRVALVKKLCESGASLAPLSLAVGEMDVFMMASGDTLVQDVRGKFAAKIALKKEYTDIMQILLKYIQPGNTSLNFIIDCENKPMLEFLLKNGLDPNINISYINRNKQIEHATLFQRICLLGMNDLAALLLSHGADPDIICNKTSLLYNLVSIPVDRVQIIRMLLESKKIKNVNQTFPNIGNETVMHMAVRPGRGNHRALLVLLLKHGARADVLNNRGLSPLHDIIASEDATLLPLFKPVLDLPLYPMAHLFSHKVCRAQKIREAGMLSSAKLTLEDFCVEKNQAEDPGYALLDLFSKQIVELFNNSKIRYIFILILKNSEFLGELCKNGSNPNYIAGDSFSPLYFAMITGSTDAVKILLEAGANPEGYEGDPENPLAMAMDASEIFKIFIRHPKCSKNSAIFINGIANNQIDAIDIMLMNHFDPLARSYAISPLFYAIYLNRTEIIHNMIASLKKMGRTEDLRTHVDYYLKIADILFKETDFIEEIRDCLKTVLQSLPARVPEKMITPPTFWNEQSKSTSSRAYLINELGMDAEAINKIQQELKNNYKKRKPLESTNTREGAKPEFTWFNGGLDLSMVSKIENTQGGFEPYIWLPEDELLEQGCPPELLKKFNSSLFKFSEFRIKPLNNLNIVKSFNINQTKCNLQLKYELKAHGTPARILLFVVQSDACNAMLLLGGKYLEKGLHNRSDIDNLRQGCIWGGACSISLPTNKASSECDGENLYSCRDWQAKHF